MERQTHNKGVPFARSRLQQLCSRSEKCVDDVQKKLNDWAIPAKEATAIIQELQAQGFVDEARYAKAFVRDKSRLLHWGTVKIKQALQAKKIPVSLITEALREIDAETYRHEFAQLLKRKAAILKAVPPAERHAKLLRFALGRGYEYHEAYELIADLCRY
jgi:regulatory protein